MASQIKVRRGAKANLPTLTSGEPGLATDTHEFFIGTPNGNLAVNGDNRNALINGNFDVWQRGTSFSNPSPGTYLSDRWLYNASGTTGQSLTISQQTFTPGQGVVPNEPIYFLRAQATVGASGQAYSLIQQKIESVRMFAGQKATLSVWLKADSARTLSISINQIFGSGGSTTTNVGNQNVNVTTAWQKFTFTFSCPSISGKTVGTNDYLSIEINLPINSTYTVDVAQVQVCAGDVALPFQPRSFAEELQLCKRYYEKSYADTETPGTATTNGLMESYLGANGSVQVGFSIKFSISKRIAPTVTTYDHLGASGKVSLRAQSGAITGGTTAAGSVSTKESLSTAVVMATTSGFAFHYTADSEI